MSSGVLEMFCVSIQVIVIWVNIYVKILLSFSLKICMLYLNSIVNNNFKNIQQNLLKSLFLFSKFFSLEITKFCVLVNPFRNILFRYRQMHMYI